MSSATARSGCGATRLDYLPASLAGGADVVVGVAFGGVGVPVATMSSPPLHHASRSWARLRAMTDREAQEATRRVLELWQPDWHGDAGEELLCISVSSCAPACDIETDPRTGGGRAHPRCGRYGKQRAPWI